MSKHDDWSLKSNIKKKTQYLTDEDKEYPVGEYFIYELRDIETLREKLIEDIEKYIDEHFEVWKGHKDDIQEKHELVDIIIFEIINKRFGYE